MSQQTQGKDSRFIFIHKVGGDNRPLCIRDTPDKKVDISLDLRNHRVAVGRAASAVRAMNNPSAALSFHAPPLP